MVKVEIYVIFWNIYQLRKNVFLHAYFTPYITPTYQLKKVFLGSKKSLLAQAS